MFNFSANHLFLISRTEYASCAVLLMLDRDTRRVYRLLDFTKRLNLRPGCAYCVAGKVNSVNTLYLVIESVKLDTKHPCPDLLVDSELESTAGLLTLSSPVRAPVSAVVKTGGTNDVKTGEIAAALNRC